MGKKKRKPSGKPLAKGYDPRRYVPPRKGEAREVDVGWERAKGLILGCLERPGLKERERKVLESRLELGEGALGKAEEKRRIKERCKEEPVWWIDQFVWQFNPRKVDGGRAVEPFVCYEFQGEALAGKGGILWCMEHQEDLVIEKSREMGASWLCLLALVYGWLFWPWAKFHMISRSEALVESADADSLFWKVDFVLDRLPTWMMPEGFERKKHRRKKFLKNPENESTITGEATTAKAGVGGRATAMLIDEFSQIMQDREVYDRTSDTAGCRIFNGTHRGQGTKFYELTRPDTTAKIRRLVMHWSQHPEKRKGAYRFDEERNEIELVDRRHRHKPDYEFVRQLKPAGGPFPALRSPYYDEQCRRKGSERAVAMDLDIDPGGSVSQVFDAYTIQRLVKSYASAPVWEGDVEVEIASGRLLGLRQESGGPLKMWVRPGHDGRLPRDRYGAGCDLSRGMGATNSCASWISSRTGEKVAEYVHCRQWPEHFAARVVALCRLFVTEDGEGSRLAWEDAGPGEQFGAAVMSMGYSNIHYREGSKEFRFRAPTRVPGWWPTPSDKDQALGDYRRALFSEECVNRCEEALKECLAYCFNEQGIPCHPGEERCEDPTGARYNHGDRVIADALAWKMVLYLSGGQRRLPGEAKEVRIVPGTLAWRKELAREKARQSEW